MAVARTSNTMLNRSGKDPSASDVGKARWLHVNQ